MLNTYLDKTTGSINIISDAAWDLLPEAVKAEKVRHDVYAPVPKVIQDKIKAKDEQNSNVLQSGVGKNTGIPGGDSKAIAGKTNSANSVGSAGTKDNTGKSQPKAGKAKGRPVAKK